ncbi:MAG: hypothetical protein ABSB09_04080 [Acidimicrobiales bacterium]
MDAADLAATGSGAHCTGCGSASCVGCGRTLDPPRFCPDCGRRLTVAVTPGGYRARCRDHGELAGL